MDGAQSERRHSVGHTQLREKVRNESDSYGREGGDEARAGEDGAEGVEARAAETDGMQHGGGER